MASMNKVILIGNLTRDPEVRYIPSGKAVADISLALNNSWTDKQSGQRHEETTDRSPAIFGESVQDDNTCMES